MRFGSIANFVTQVGRCALNLAVCSGTDDSREHKACKACMAQGRMAQGGEKGNVLCRLSENSVRINQEGENIKKASIATYVLDMAAWYARFIFVVEVLVGKISFLSL